MTPYLLAYGFYFISFAFGGLLRRPRWGLLLGVLPFAALIMFRGLVGVDLPNYEHVTELIRDNEGLMFLFEPLFETLLFALGKVFEEVPSVLLVVSGITIVILFSAFLRLNEQAHVLALAIVPYFLLDMTMNGLRYGLAFAIIAYGASSLIRGNTSRYALFVIVAGLMQVSALALGALLFVLLSLRIRAIFVAGCFGLAGLTVAWDHLAEKLELNLGVVTQSAGAGLAPLLLCLMLLFACSLQRASGAARWPQLAILLGLAVLAFGVTQFLYVGLRLQQLVLFLTALYLACTMGQSKMRFTRAAVVVLWCVGIAGGGFRLKNFYNDAGQGDAPFAPYTFYWER